MGFFKSTPDQSVILATRTPAEKVQFHIERYDRAIAQCEKGPERLKQLKREREFWCQVKRAQEA